MSDIFHNTSGRNDVVLYTDNNTMWYNTSIEATKLHFNKKPGDSTINKTPMHKRHTNIEKQIRTRPISPPKTGQHEDANTNNTYSSNIQHYIEGQKKI
jgi:hypothetical protein